MKNNTIWVSNITKDTKLSFMNNLQSDGIYFLLVSIKSLFGIYLFIGFIPQEICYIYSNRNYEQYSTTH